MLVGREVLATLFEISCPAASVTASLQGPDLRADIRLVQVERSDCFSSDNTQPSAWK